MAGFFGKHFGTGSIKNPAATCKGTRGIIHVEVQASRAGTVAPSQAVAGVTATVTGQDNPAAKPTESNGRRAFGPLHGVNTNYTATIAFPGDLAEKYDVVAGQTQPLTPGGVTLFTFRTHWHWIEFQVRDSQNRPAANLGFRLFHRSLVGAAAWTKIEDGVTPNNGDVRREVVRRGRYKLRIPALTNAAWSSPTLEIGTAIQLTATVTGFDAGETGEFQILDAFDHSKVLATAPGTIVLGGGGRQLRANWTPAEASFKKLEHSQVIFRAKAGVAETLSERRTLLRTEALELQHADGTAIDTQITLHFSGGTQWAAANTPGGTVQAKIPWNEHVVRIHLPNLRNCRVRVEDQDKLLAIPA